MVSNPGLYSRFTTGSSLGQILDAADAPHTGLIKALSLGLGQNYAISGFNITKNSVTALAVASGKIIRDGELVSVSATSSDLTLTANVYHLIVVDSSNAIVIRTGTSTTVPDYSAGDVIIAAAKHDSTEAHIQYLTLGKTKNSISVARDNSGYTEEGTIKAASGGGIDLITTQTNQDIRITPNGSGKIVLDGLNWPIADGGANQVLKTDGGGQLSFTAAYGDSDAVSAVETEAGLNFSTSSSNAIIENTTQDKDIIFKVNDGGASTEVMRIDGDVSRVGIATDTPDKLLHLSANTDATLRIESTKTTVATNDVVGAIEWEGQDSSTGSAGVGAKIDVINENATPDFAMRFFTQKAVGGTPTFSEKMRITSDGKVAIGNTSPSVELDVTGQFRLSSHAELNGDLDHDGSNVGFFGTAVAAQQSVGNLGSSAVQPKPAPNPSAFNGFEPSVDVYVSSLETEIGNLRTKVDALIDALQLYGLIT